MATRYRVIQVKGAKPETFMVVGIDFEQALIKSTSKPMPETEMRAHLQKESASETEINEWLEQARKYPG